MSDTSIFIIGFFVFGVAIASTMIAVIPPSSSKDIQRRRELDHPEESPSRAG